MHAGKHICYHVLQSYENPFCCLVYVLLPHGQATCGRTVPGRLEAELGERGTDQSHQTLC